MVRLAEGVVVGTARNAVAVVRPPGHHAECNQIMGFCLYNNVAVAARVVQRRRGVKRILILDWDIHHGNATEHSFEDDDGIMYVARGEEGGYNITYILLDSVQRNRYTLVLRMYIFPLRP